MISDAEFESITLPLWPTAGNALAWSAENLAVAAGESVHVLTPRSAFCDRGDERWQIFTLRVNQFGDEEWPQQQLCPIGTFSVGEELSESTVVQLELSPPGLSLHQRSVLAVLTSNLLLSFWETDGTVGNWQRTAIVNGFPDAQAHVDHNEINPINRRVRAFHWLPALPSATSAKWGRHILVLADDNYNVSFLLVRKDRSDAYGHWSLEVLARYRLSGFEHLSGAASKQLGLRTILIQSSSISKFANTEWKSNPVADTTAQNSLVLEITIGSTTRLLAVQAEQTTAPGIDHKTRLLLVPVEECSNARFETFPVETAFAAALEIARSEFDQNFGTSGKIRSKIHGTASSPDKARVAAAVTLHPSETIEYGKPATQRTMVLFGRGADHNSHEELEVDVGAVRKRIIDFVTYTFTGALSSTLDRTIIALSINIINSQYQDCGDLTAWAAKAIGQLEHPIANPDVHDSNSPDDMSVDAHRTGAQDHSEELCELCTSIIPLGTDLASATCAKGHHFTRCNLSFVAIQEPGISKDCSKCGRQFLHLAKMRLTTNGPSLFHALAKEFDVCPFCQGKFRG